MEASDSPHRIARRGRNRDGILDKLPEVMRKSAALGAELGAAHQSELQEMIAERAKRLADNAEAN